MQHCVLAGSPCVALPPPKHGHITAYSTSPQHHRPRAGCGLPRMVQPQRRKGRAQGLGTQPHRRQCRSGDCRHNTQHRNLHRRLLGRPRGFARRTYHRNHSPHARYQRLHPQGYMLTKALGKEAAQHCIHLFHRGPHTQRMHRCHTELR